MSAVNSFEVDCQANPNVTAPTPKCSMYLAVAEDCRNDTAAMGTGFNDGLNITQRISFHKVG